MKFFLRTVCSSLLTAGVLFFIILTIASSVNGVSIPTQFNQWFLF